MRSIELSCCWRSARGMLPVKLLLEQRGTEDARAARSTYSVMLKLPE
jgi:hypothetical protein